MKESDSKSQKGSMNSKTKTHKSVQDKPLISKHDIQLFHKGNHYKCYKFMGSHFTKENRRLGVRFTTWAPKAQSVVVTGSFNDWNIEEKYSLERISKDGLWSIFIPGIKEQYLYKYEITTLDGKKVLKSDPYAFYSEKRPNTASIMIKPKEFKWKDEKWVEYKNSTNVYNSPVNIYELHLGSWKRDEYGNFLSYKDMAKILPSYVKEMGYTHIELMPIMEHPLDDSWGYQVTGYYSVTSRFGDIKDFKYFVDSCHKQGIGVILDWVPGHFCKDEHGLFEFDGTPTYEYEEKSKAENEGWGAANFDLGKPEVKSFLISNALFWIKEYHIDGLRVDAVANMIYLDYDRKAGEWKPNKQGGRENLEAIEFLRELNSALFKEFPNFLMIAEESTSWPLVTRPVDSGGLGFNFKWNMGWMNDILKYFSIDPLYRKKNHNLITFSMMYNYSENFILPISHDEVVHGKKSLIDKMWGDYWNKFAGLRLFMAYMYTHPGKKTIFMGCEFAQFIEWRHYESLEWKLIDQFDSHKKTQNYFKRLNELYLNHKALWELDYDEEGFQWIDADNSNQSILVFMRKSKDPKDTLIVLCNFTPVVYYDYDIGVPYLGEYEELLNTDSEEFGGSGQIMGEKLYAKRGSWHNQKYHLTIKVPPMAALILKINSLALDKEEVNKIKEA